MVVVPVVVVAAEIIVGVIIVVVDRSRCRCVNRHSSFGGSSSDRR